jgi:hypothetical protein
VSTERKLKVKGYNPWVFIAVFFGALVLVVFFATRSL